MSDKSESINTNVHLSAVIITKNEANKITACLESLGFCDEILVVDSGSSDETVSLCQQLGARVIYQEWLGYGAQKGFAVSRAAHDWVICVDADERVSEALRSSIESAIDNPAYGAYEMPRCNFFLGRWLRHGEGYPDYSLRLFNRNNAQWSDDRIHEKVVASVEVGRLSGDLLHESSETIEQYLNKQNRYTSLQAEDLVARGKKVTATKLLLSPLIRFIKFYVVRRGFLDGVPGMLHIAIGCFNSFSKYAKAIELRQRDP